MKLIKIIIVALLFVNIAKSQQLINKTNIINIQNKINYKSTPIQIDRQSKFSDNSLLEIPDDIDGRLFKLCKIWGYFKYFHQDKCTIEWDTLLNTTIKQVLASTSNSDFNDILMGMFNKVGNNTFIQENNDFPDINLNFNNAWIMDTMLSETVRNFLNTFTTHIQPNTSTCFIKYNLTYEYFGFIDFSNDIITMPIDYTIEEDRLTVMFYYWNVINYFFPYQYLMEQSWDTTLYQFIPLIRQSNNDNSFHKTFLKLTTKTNDTHAYTYSDILRDSFWGGRFMPPIFLTRVDTHCVVVKTIDDLTIKAGDILSSINGISIKDIEDSLAHFIPASTPASFYRDLYEYMLKGFNNSNIDLSFIDSLNNSYNITLTRSIDGYLWHKWIADNEYSSPFFITTCGYGYVNMGKLTIGAINAMYNALKNTPAIIFDLRNYPLQTIWNLSPLFFTEPITSAIFNIPALTYYYIDAYYYYYMPGWYYSTDNKYNMGEWINPEAYTGDIYILVNETTQSQAEYTCQHLSYHPNAKVIGRQTAGANGDVSFLELPGGIYTYFTSVGTYYADGYEQQRNGVKIDSIVSPTIVGLRNGVDEILQAVFNCQTDLNKPITIKYNTLLYPNPNSTKLFIEIEENTNILDFKIINSLGHIVYKGNVVNKAIVNTKNFKSGIYLVIIECDNTYEISKFIKE